MDSGIVLCVDDDSTVLNALRSVFSSHFGPEVEFEFAESGEEALEIDADIRSQGRELSLMVSDFMMPGLPDELNQVWTNLVHNALQAMQHKGTLRIGLRRDGNWAGVSIGDTGCGIPEAIRERIFDAFFTTKRAGEGTGLGLDIVRKIVEKHGGQIAVDSEVGRGTTFTVSLPIEGME